MTNAAFFLSLNLERQTEKGLNNIRESEKNR